jgi:hypothetical protein
MSVDQIQALAQKFADAFDRGDIKRCSTCFQTISRCLIPSPIGSTASLFLLSFSTMLSRVSNQFVRQVSRASGDITCVLVLVP